MERTVNREIIDKWIDRNSPNGLASLAIASGISSGTISKIRLGYVPEKSGTRIKLAKALIVNEDDLFPEATGEDPLPAA